MTMLYKIVHGHVAITPADFGLEPADRRTRASHRHKFKRKAASGDLIKYSFVNRTVPDWNSLPTSVAEAESLDIFKAQLSHSKAP